MNIQKIQTIKLKIDSFKSEIMVLQQELLKEVMNDDFSGHKYQQSIPITNLVTQDLKAPTQQSVGQWSAKQKEKFEEEEAQIISPEERKKAEETAKAGVAAIKAKGVFVKKENKMIGGKKMELIEEWIGNPKQSGLYVDSGDPEIE